MTYQYHKQNMYVATSYDEILHIKGIAEALAKMSEGAKKRRNTKKTNTNKRVRTLRFDAIMRAVTYAASFEQAVANAERMVAEAAAEYVSKLI